MTTRVPIRYGGTGANTAAGARAALGVLANTGGTISGDLTITGNLTVSGNTTTLNTETLMIEDADIVLLSNVTGSPVLNAGITINRGNSTNTFLRWDEGADKWGWSDDGANTYTFDTALSAYSQANAAYSQANAAYTAANNAKVTVFANNSSNVTTQNINFVNTSTVTVTVSADGSNANVAFTAAPQTVVVDTYAASGNTTAAATANIANGLFAIATNAYTQANDANSLANTANNLANSAYAQANSAYTAANNAANTVRVSQNSTSTLSAKQLNFVNTANVTIVVADSGDGNANISFEVASGTGTLSNIGISSNGVFTTNANAFNFVNTSTVSVSVSSGVNGNANIAFNATVVGVNTVIRSETFTSANAAANLTYNILYYPVAVEYVFVNKNGIGLFPTTDYTLSGNTVTIKEAGEGGDNIEIRYFVDVSTVPVSNTTIIVEANTVTAQTNTFTLSQNVATINRLSVTKNGLQLTPNTHYTLANGKTVTLTTLAEVDDQIVFRYFFDLGNIQDVGFTAYQQANAAYDQANLAYTAANNRVLKTGDTLTGTLNVQNVIPTTSNTYNLGSSSARFKDLWLSNSTIYLGDASISANAGKIIVPAIETSSGINLESQVASAYGQANSAYTQANSAYSQANAGYTQANSGYTQANAAYTQANSAYGQANSAYTQANSAYGQANAGYTQANSAYTAANTAQTTAQNAYSQANAAYLQANTAYLAANNSNLKLGGVISGTLNVTNDIIVGGNVYLQGNTTFINVATYQINDALMYIAANNTLTDSVDIGFVGAKNTSGTFSHTGLARDATDGKYKLFDNLADSGHVGNVIDFANTSLATLVANVEANTLSVVNGVSGNVNFDSGTLFVNSVGNAVGIGTTNPSTELHIYKSNGPTINLQAGGNGTKGLRIVKGDSGTAYVTNVDSADLVLGTNNTNRVIITGEGLVGIGTSTIPRRLTIPSTTTGNYEMIVGAGASVSQNATLDVICTHDNNAFQVWDDNNLTTPKFVVKRTGNVGIGTTNPAYNLDVNNSAGETIAQFVNGSGRGYVRMDGYNDMTLQFYRRGASVAFIQTDTSGTEFYAGTSGAYPFAFYTNNTEKMRITSAGNVGIGGGTAAKLHVTYSFSGSTATTFGKVSESHIHLGNPGYNNQYCQITFGYDTTNAAAAFGFTSTDQSGSTKGALVFATRNVTTSTLPTERMRIDSAGNVGIGTTNPGELLTVNGSVGLQRSGTQYWHLSVDANNALNFTRSGVSDRATISSDGNVGINTTSPLSKLYIQGTGSTSSAATVNSNALFASSIFLYDAGNGSTTNSMVGYFGNMAGIGGLPAGIGIARESDGNWGTQLRFYTHKTTTSDINELTERVRIVADGNVGIGATAPQSRLEVNLVSGDSSSLMNANAVNDVALLRAPFGVNPASASNGQAKWGLRFVGRNDGTYDNGKSAAIYAVSEETAAGYNRTVGLAFHTSSFDASHTERMRITNTGNVGIGTTSPGYKLDVNGNIGSSSLSPLAFYGNGNSGTYTPTVIYANQNNTSGSTTNGLFIERGRLTDSSSGEIRSFVIGDRGGGIQFILNGSGNVGIGTSSPGYTLDLLSSTAGYVANFKSSGNYGGVLADAGSSGSAGGGYFAVAKNGSRSGLIGVTGAWIGDSTTDLAISSETGKSIRFFTNGSATPSAIITSGGNIGIGTTSSDYARVHIRESGITAAAISTGWPAYNAESATQSKYVLHLDAGSNGSVTTAGQGPSAVLLIGNYYDSRGIITMLGAGGGSPSDGGTGYGKDLMVKAGNSDNGNGYIGGRLFLAGGSGYSGGAFGTNFGSIIMQSQGGNVCIGTTATISSYAHLHIRGSQKGVAIQNSDSGYYRAIYVSSTNLYFYNGTNEGYLNDSGAWINASDIRIKKDITEIKYGLNAVMAAQPRSYKMKSSDKECIGFVAQEMLEVIPEVVSGDVDPEKNLGLDYGSLVAVAFKAIQELKAELDAAKLRITELENN